MMAEDWMEKDMMPGCLTSAQPQQRTNKGNQLDSIVKAVICGIHAVRRAGSTEKTECASSLFGRLIALQGGYVHRKNLLGHVMRPLSLPPHIRLDFGLPHHINQLLPPTE